MVDVGHSEVLPLDQTICEEPVVMRPGFLVNGEKKNPASLPVEPVHRGETAEPCASLQTNYQRALDIVLRRALPASRAAYPR